MPPPLLSVILITRNESHRLQRCLDSVSFADEVIVVDHGSTDGTPALARQLGAQVFETPDWPGFGPQKNRALEQAGGTWVLSIDADEWLDADLALQIQSIVRAARLSVTPAGYALPRLSSFCGQWMRHSGWYPDPVVRLFQRGSGRFSDDLVHERLMVDGPVLTLGGGHLLHESHPTLELAIDKMNRYSTGRAQDLLGRGRRGGVGRAIGHGMWAFVRTYVLRRGFLDGRLGFVLAVNNAEVSFYRYVKMWLEARHERALDTAAGLALLDDPHDLHHADEPTWLDTDPVTGVAGAGPAPDSGASAPVPGAAGEPGATPGPAAGASSSPAAEPAGDGLLPSERPTTPARPALS